jgi:hypothetical protein
MKWITWREYAEARGLPEEQRRCSGPRSGTTLYFDPTEALAGPWTENRFHLGQIIAYLELPATRAALQTVCDLSGGPQCLTNPAVNPAGFMGYSAIRETAKLLTARARYHLVHKHDYPAAAADLEAVLQLSAGMEDDGLWLPVLVGMACRGLAVSEATEWAGMELLTAEQAKDLTARLDRHRFRGEKAMQRALDGEYACSMSYLDAIFAPGEHGRQVLCASVHRPGNWLARSLNLLSPLTYDRAEGRRWVQAIGDLNRMADGPAAQRARAERLNELVQTDPLFSLAGTFGMRGFERMSVLNARTEGEEEAARTALALAMFKAKHGQYPARLEELVPDYLPALRPDPFADRPLGYRVESDGHFTLYSVGEDRQDDGGKVTANGYGPSRDIVYTYQSGPDQEWVLVRAESVSRPTSAPSEPNSDGPRMSGPFGPALR